jgi:hypothetical protein
MSGLVRYSEAFKLRLAGDVANGKYASLDEAGRRPGIREAQACRLSPDADGRGMRNYPARIKK